nr:pyruvate kinase [uncultured Desulfobulbus sp.]
MQQKKIEGSAGISEHQIMQEVLDELQAIRAKMVDDVAKCAPRLKKIHPSYRKSAENLLHYLVLRRRDRRQLQQQLAVLGLSSLGRSESHVLATINAVIRGLHRLQGREDSSLPKEDASIDFALGEQLLSDHAEALLGAAAQGRSVRIMVTMPSEAAHDYDLVHNLLQQGMECMRINCAHDDAAAWFRMIEHLRRAEHSLGRSCQVVMDLAGPKLRTGPIERGPAVVRIRPKRDKFGVVIAPARVWLTADSAPCPPPSPADACIPVSAEWLEHLKPRQQVHFIDARGTRRTMIILDRTDWGCWGELSKTAYLIPGALLWCKKGNDNEEQETIVGELPSEEGQLLLRQGDMLILTRDQRVGRPATYDSKDTLLTPAMIGMTLPEVFDDVCQGETIWFDDGKIGGVIEAIEESQVMVKITHARFAGEKLRSDKGINFPDSMLSLPALTEKDIHDLAFVAQHADVVELSFANSDKDVELLHQSLERLGKRQPAIVLKVETRRGFANLPAMLLAAMEMPRCGVMIARGDLAVECGFERMAEVQEEILWICEAAHVPVIWATQVLESLAKDGMPSRAEISDASMGHRAECVMLNKGPHVVTAVRMLDGILRRMQAHQFKKRAMLRELNLAHCLQDSPPAEHEG